MKQEKEKYVINPIPVSKNIYTWKNKNAKKMAYFLTTFGARCPKVLHFQNEEYIAWYDWFPYNDTVYTAVTIYNRLTKLIRSTPDAPDYYLHYRTAFYNANKQYFKDRPIVDGLFETTQEEFDEHLRKVEGEDYGNE